MADTETDQQVPYNPIDDESVSLDAEEEAEFIEKATEKLGISQTSIIQSIENRTQPTEPAESDSDTSAANEEISEEKGIGKDYVLKPIETEKKQPTREDVEAKAKEFRAAIKNEASDLNKQHKLEIHYEDFAPTSPNFNKHLANMFGTVRVPPSAVEAERDRGELLDTSVFVETTAGVKDYKIEHVAVDLSNVHSLPDMVVIVHKLNSLFKYSFMNIHTTDFQFNTIINKTLAFLEQNKCYECSKGDGNIIRSFIGKCIILLNTQAEDALRLPGINNVHVDLVQTLMPDIEQMNKSIARSGSRLYVSWLTFVNGLLSVDNKNSVYRHSSYKLLNDRLIACYGADPRVPKWFGVIEHFFGTMLKSYIPSIVCDYFYALRSVYIIVRLITIYQAKRLYAGKTVDEIATDLRMIGSLGVIIYESLFNSLRTLMRSFPKLANEEKKEIEDPSNNPISPEFQQYIHVHMICGGQYHLLRAIEESIPVLAGSLSKLK